MTTRLTKREWQVIWDCLAFVQAGEIDGGPLEGDNAKDQAANIAALESAMAKLARRKP